MNDDKRRRLDRTMSKENPTPEDMRVVFDEWLRLGRIAEGLKERVRSHLRFALQRKDQLLPAERRWVELRCCQLGVEE